MPGQVWQSGQPLWISNIVKKTSFPRIPIAIREGLQSGFGFPVSVGDWIVGVMEFVSRDVREPDEPLLATLRALGS